ncbi:MAG: SDR family NAD(P)-dependent oxidoreductase [Rhodospirillales bacterium]|nr:SDR family NAD(P)-dependent oxidoreductase [Rhodospirillales bacterium]
MVDNEQGAALIIGAGDALGGAIAHRFARAGFVAVPSRRKLDQLERLTEDIERAGFAARGMACDARDEDQVIALFDRIEAEIGPVEVAVFNAGAQHNASITDMTARIYRQVWESATLGGFLMGREAARRMVPRRRGTIIFTGATASIRAGAGFAAFAGAKYALRALSQSMAKELGPKGIHVAHVIIDGMIESDAVRERFPDRTAAKGEDGMLDPAAIAESYYQLHAQPRSAWSWELDLRPWSERW